ncbi:unnamed protein product, partial [Amoebophrya sp. A25]
EREREHLLAVRSEEPLSFGEQQSDVIAMVRSSGVPQSAADLMDKELRASRRSLRGMSQDSFSLNRTPTSGCGRQSGASFRFDFPADGSIGTLPSQVIADLSFEIRDRTSSFSKLLDTSSRTSIDGEHGRARPRRKCSSRSPEQRRMSGSPEQRLMSGSPEQRRMSGSPDRRYREQYEWRKDKALSKLVGRQKEASQVRPPARARWSDQTAEVIAGELAPATSSSKNKQTDHVHAEGENQSFRVEEGEDHDDEVYPAADKVEDEAEADG